MSRRRRALVVLAGLVGVAAALAWLPPYPLVVWAFLLGVAATLLAVGVAIYTLATADA